MRVFLAVLVLIFSFQSWTKADDISDFEIEGMSIGDSLLDYASKEEINASMITDYKSKLYSRFTIRSINLNPLELYDDIQVHFKTKDKNFIIVSMSGGIYNSNEFDQCLKDKKQVIKDISTILPNTMRIDGGTSPWLTVDSSGKTITSTYYFNFGSNKYNDYIEVACYDWNEELDRNMRGNDHLKVAAHSKKFGKWMSEEAY